MSTYTYRVSVERIEHDDDGDFTRSTTLFEASSPNAGRLNGFAPDEVASALHYQGIVTATPMPATAPEPVLENAPEPDTTEASAPSRPARKRRTKAEIEADRLAAEGMAVVEVGEASAAFFEQMAQENAATPTAPSAAPDLPAAEPTPAPYNPFLPK